MDPRARLAAPRVATERLIVDAARWQRIKDLFAAALELESDARASLLQDTCAGDADLRIEIESLLLAHADTDGFLDGAAAADVIDPQQLAEHSSWIGRRLGAYRIVAEIGRGGMSEVFQATRDDDEYHREVAIKVMQAGLDSRSLVQRFKIEMQILATLDHPNIARLHDGGRTQEGLPYLVMEYIRGRPIDQYCAEHSLGVAQRLELFLTLCRAVQYVHQHLMVHGDLKCSNVLVADDGAVKLLDFGIAKLLTALPRSRPPESTSTLLIALTPEYASPEQLRGGAITTATDVYSLGVVLFRLLTGVLPSAQTL